MSGIRTGSGSHLFFQKRFIFYFLSDICRTCAGPGLSMDTG